MITRKSSLLFLILTFAFARAVVVRTDGAAVPAGGPAVAGPTITFQKVFKSSYLEVHKRLASLGQKTFTYENGSEKHELTFNYTLDPTGAELTSLFENISQQ